MMRNVTVTWTGILMMPKSIFSCEQTTEGNQDIEENMKSIKTRSWNHFLNALRVRQPNITTSSKGGPSLWDHSAWRSPASVSFVWLDGKLHDSHVWFHSLFLFVADQFSAWWIFSSARLQAVILFPLRDFIYLCYDPLCVTLKFYSLLFLIHQGALQGSLNIIGNILS